MDKIGLIDKLDYLHRELAKSGIDSNTYKNLSGILIDVKSELREENSGLVEMLKECMRVLSSVQSPATPAILLHREIESLIKKEEPTTPYSEWFKKLKGI